MRWLDSATDLMDMNLTKLWERVQKREAWHMTGHGVTKSQTRLSDWTTNVQLHATNCGSLDEITNSLPSEPPGTLPLASKPLPKYWSFSFNNSSSNENSRLISFTIDWLDLLAVQGTLKSLFQHHSSKSSILWHSAFVTVQLSHPYMTKMEKP